MIGRRSLLRGAAALPIAGMVPALASPLSLNDARLIAIADAYEALHREANASHSTAPGWDALICRFSDLEQEMAETPADSLPGVLAKARLCQVSTARECAELDHLLSAIDDLWRLAGTGALS